MYILLSVFIFCYISQHREVTLVAGEGYIAILDRLADGTARFVDMDAIRIAAVTTDTEYLAEVMPYLFALHIQDTKTLDARGVDEP